MSHTSSICQQVAAVFATMHRIGMVEQCILHLLHAKTRPGCIVIIDNGNDAALQQSLHQLDQRPEVRDWRQQGGFIDYLPSGQNLGNAGAIALALQRAFRAGYEYAWILDDDAYAHPLALDSLMQNYLARPEAVFGSLVVAGNKDGYLAWPMLLKEGAKQQFITKLQDLPNQKLLECGCWLGLLLPRKVWSSIGNVRAELFLRGEDEEYPRRMLKAGYHCLVDRAALVSHPYAGPVWRLSMFGYNLIIEPGLHGVKLAYRVRNMVWLCRQHSRLKAALLSVAYLLVYACMLRAHDLKLILNSIYRAYTNKLGKITGK